MCARSAWTNETLARVTAAELGGDVAAAERLVERHRDIKAEIDAKEDDYRTLYADGMSRATRRFNNRVDALIVTDIF